MVLSTENTGLAINVWVILDKQLFILGVRAKFYCAAGTDAQRLEFLESRARLDYFVAQEFPPPEFRFDPLVENPDDYERAPPIHVSDERLMRDPVYLCSHAITMLYSNLAEERYLEEQELAVENISYLVRDLDGNERVLC